MFSNKSMVLTLAGLVLGVASTAASASCTKYGTVEQVYQNSTYAYIYIKPIGALSSSTYHYCWTNDRDLGIAAHAAKDGNAYVRVTGTASSCPSSGSISACTVIQRY